jgi:hypothetical protein
MAKKSSAGTNRKDPKSNKSLATRLVLKKIPNGTFAEVSKAVQEEYGHDIGTSLFYAIKTKSNMKANRRANPGSGVAAPMNSAATWVEAIKIARNLLRVTGSIDNATALLKAVGQ